MAREKRSVREKKSGQLHFIGSVRKSWDTANRKQAVPEQDNSRSYDYSVAVFCASSTGHNPGFTEDAKTVGRSLAENNWRLVYGGGDFGIMGTVSKAALDKGGVIKGVIIDLFNQEGAYPQKEFEVSTPDIYARKKMMMEEADAYIVLAGGFGTLDELAEAGGEQYLGSYHSPPVPVKPIIVVNRDGLYDGYKKQLEDMVAAGLANEKVLDMFTYVKDGEEAIETLQRLKNEKVHYLPCIGNVDHRKFSR